MSRSTMQEDEALAEIGQALQRKRKQEAFNRFNAAIAILMVFSIFPYIWAFHYVGFCLHKNQVHLGEVNMVARGWSDVLEEYAIDFTVDVSFKKYDVREVEFHVLIYKGEKFIGNIQVDLIGNTAKEIDGTEYQVFKQDSEETLYFSLRGWRDLSKSDPLFQELYNGNTEDYTFVPKLMCVSFADGTSVGYSNLGSLDYQYDENGEIQFSDNYLTQRGYWWK